MRRSIPERDITARTGEKICFPNPRSLRRRQHNRPTCAVPESARPPRV